ncbi:MAG: hypothetical protein ACOYVD_10700 [Bacillota bacterium]
MFLCLDPGSKYLGYTLINDFQIVKRGVIHTLKQDPVFELSGLLNEYPRISTVLIEKGENDLRSYEAMLLETFRQKNLMLLLFNAKEVRKKLRLERHPSSLGIVAKKEIVSKFFPSFSLTDAAIHELDSILLYIYFHKVSG